jgi:hypothetical protein
MLLTGTDWNGRRELERRYQGLIVKERRIREVKLAQYSGFVMRGDGKLNYGTATGAKGFIEKLRKGLTNES